MVSRQRAPEIKDRKMIECPDCEKTGVNRDYNPASSLINNLCQGCGGLGQIDKKLGVLPPEQIIKFFRDRAVVNRKNLDYWKNKYKHDTTVLNAFHKLLIEHNQPHDATKDQGTGHFGAKLQG